MSTVRTILLVEDDPDAVLLVERVFRKAAWPEVLRVAVDGEAAKSLLASVPAPALVLLDWKLPRGGGAEVLAWLRAQPFGRQLPVVVMTSSTQAADIDAAYRAGASSYLRKPVEFAALAAQLAALRAYWIEHHIPPPAHP